VLDISEKSLEKAKERLGKRASRVRWIACDVTEFQPTTTYACWHDRATFHFLTDHKDIDAYLSVARQAVKEFMVVGTFSDKGPRSAACWKFTGIRKKNFSNSLPMDLRN
jgi:hypothetical protein